MSEEATQAQRGTGRIAAALVFCVALVGGVVYMSQQEADTRIAPVSGDVTAPSAAPATVETAAVQPKPKLRETETLSVSEPVETEQQDDIETVKVTAPTLGVPTFDYVRVDAQGMAVIAGRSEKGAVVDLMGNGKKLGEAQVTGNGSFAAVLAIQDRSAPVELSMVARRGDQRVPSSDTFLVLPTASDAQPVVVKADASGVARVDTPLPEPSAPALVTQPETELPKPPVPPAPERTASLQEDEPLPTAPKLADSVVTSLSPGLASPDAPQLSDPGAATDPVAQGAVPQPSITAQRESSPGVDTDQAIRLVAPDAVTDLTLDTINYSDTGDVILTGRGRGDQSVRVYVDNQPVTLGPIEGGQWRLALPDIDEGIYTIRVDALDPLGAVTARVESPFKRETPDLIAVAGAAVTIQPGFTLWQLAEQSYGSGQRYVQIYEANRDSIRDPDLIYPGQVFDIPK